MNTDKNHWSKNEKIVARLFELANAEPQYSYGQVAMMLSEEFKMRFNRNMVIGFANRNAARLTREKKMQFARKDQDTQPKRRPNNLRKFDPDWVLPEMRDEDAPRPEKTSRLRRRPVEFSLVIGGRDPTGEGCKWLDDNGCACGAKLFNRSYCAEHYERSVDRPRMNALRRMSTRAIQRKA